MTTPSTIPVSPEQAERAARIMVADNISYDSLVGLALDAYEAMQSLSAHTGELLTWSNIYKAVIDGSPYIEAVTDA